MEQSTSNNRVKRSRLLRRISVLSKTYTSEELDCVDLTVNNKLLMPVKKGDKIKKKKTIPKKNYLEDKED